VRIVANDGDWKTLLGLLDKGESDGLFGYLSTSSAAVRKAGGDVATTLRFLEFKQALPEFYGSVLMVSPQLKRAEPAIARGIVNAVNRGMMDALCAPDEAIAALARRDPKQVVVVEKGRLLDTIREDMDGAGIPARGVGGIGTSRMEASIELALKARNLPRRPAVVDVFTPEFLPAIGQRTPACAKPGEYRPAVADARSEALSSLAENKLQVRMMGLEASRLM
jgi:NitT/TauT family transport system substrate-binding protein